MLPPTGKEDTMNTIVNILMSPHFVAVMVALALALAAIICVVQFFRTPPLLKRRFDRAVRRCRLKNEQGEYPVLVSARRDHNKAHGLILKFRNVGVTVTECEKKYGNLKIMLKGVIYDMH